LKIINVEDGRPTVDEARKRLIEELRQARQAGVRTVKIIHGYGSSGVGGALQSAIRKSLLLRRKEGLVSIIIFGEKLSIFEKDTREAFQQCPELRGDSDVDRENRGITIALLTPVAKG
jgi:Smr domain